MAADNSQFERRLSWDGLAVDEVRRAFAKSWPADDPRSLPSMLEEYAAEVADRGTAWSLDPSIDANAPLPFEDVLLPFVGLARRRISETAPVALEQLGGPSWAILTRALLTRLTWLCERVLGLEFSIYRATRSSPVGVYRSFVDVHRSAGLRELCEVYPVLARLIVLVTDEWITANSEMLHQMLRDRSELESLFGKLGKVTAVTPGLSDFHGGGRSVCVLIFESGIRLVYKPKGLEIEEAWNHFLHWINASGAALDLKTFRVLSRQEYGWAEYVETRGCASADELDRFSLRAGMLTFLAYLLDATDLHFENVVCCGEHPCIVDLETLLHPWVTPPEEEPAGNVLENPPVWHASVLRSGLLRLGADQLQGTPDLSGFGPGPPVFSTPDDVYWVAVNSDDMAMATGPGSAAGDAVPGRTPVNHGMLIKGFKLAYRHITSCRERLLSLDSPLAAFASLQVRFVFRATGDYTRLMVTSRSPTLLRDPLSRSVYFEALRRVATALPERPAYWPLLKAEIRAIESLDVPLFVARTDSRDLVLNSGDVLLNYFAYPGIDRVIACVQRLSEEDLSEQTRRIEEAFRDENRASS